MKNAPWQSHKGKCHIISEVSVHKSEIGVSTVQLGNIEHENSRNQYLSSI